MFVLIAVVVIASILVIAALMTLAPTSSSSQPDLNHLTLRVGNYLNYRISGSIGNDTFGSYDNITVMQVNGSALGFGSEGFSLGTIQNFGHDFQVYLGSQSISGNLIGNEKINTSFGLKSVEIFYKYDLNENEILLADIGQGSNLTYRWTVSSASGTYQYAYELVATNNTQISTADKVMVPASPVVLNTVSPGPCPHDGFGLFPPGTGFFEAYQGSLIVEPGQQFHYILAGENMTMYVFNLTDFMNTEGSGHLQYYQSLSRLPGNPGETNVNADPGIYWYIVIYRGSTHAIIGGIEGGSLTPYWGVNGQDYNRP